MPDAVSALKAVLQLERSNVGGMSFSVSFDQTKHRIRAAGPGHGDVLGDVRRPRSSSGKGAGANDACDRGHREESPPRRVDGGGNIMGWSIADVFVGGVLSTLSAWVMGFASFVARVRAGVEVATFPSACFRVIQKV